MKKNQLFFVIVGAFSVGVASVHVMRKGVLEQMASYALYPCLRLQHMVVKPVQDFCARRERTQKAAAHTQALQAEREALMEENIRLRSSLDYMADIKELVDFSAQYEVGKERCVQIIFKHVDQSQQYVLIDAGARQGVAVDTVAVYKNMLLGKVVEVYPQYSKVLLITDKTCKVAAYCAATGATGIHEGCNQRQTVLNHVSHLATIAPGSLVLSSGSGTIFPRGFALGEVADCALNGMVYDVRVKPLADIKNIDYCYLLKKGEVSHEQVADGQSTEKQPEKLAALATSAVPEKPTAVVRPAKNVRPVVAAPVRVARTAPSPAHAASAYPAGDTPQAVAAALQQEVAVAHGAVVVAEAASAIEEIPAAPLPVVAERAVEEDSAPAVQRKKRSRRRLWRSEPEIEAAPVVIAQNEVPSREEIGQSAENSIESV